MTYVQIQEPPVTAGDTLGMLLNISVPQFLYL